MIHLSPIILYNHETLRNDMLSIIFNEYSIALFIAFYIYRLFLKLSLVVRSVHHLTHLLASSI